MLNEDPKKSNAKNEYVCVNDNYQGIEVVCPICGEPTEPLKVPELSYIEGKDTYSDELVKEEIENNDEDLDDLNYNKN